MNKKGLYSVPQAVTVAPEPDIDLSLIGKEGKFSWAYNVPAQGILNLLLSWEATYPHGSHVIGLDM